MEQFKIRKLIAPVLLLVLVLVDGHITAMLGTWSQYDFFIHSHIALLFLLFYLPYCSRAKAITISLVIGIISDLYYVGIVGIDAFTFPIIALLCHVFLDSIEESSFSQFLLFILSTIIAEALSFGLQLVFTLISGGILYFISRVLAPTLLFNIIVVFSALLFPLKKMFPYVTK